MQKGNPVIKNYILSSSVYILENHDEYIQDSNCQNKTEGNRTVKFCNKNNLSVHLYNR